jgi:5'(3')-deoxyribonucleotidase
MDKQVVLLDCDGVLFDFVRACLDWIEQRTGVLYDTSVIRTWDPFDSLPDRVNVSELKPEFEQYMSGPGACSSILPYPEALEGVRELVEIADVYAVTAPWWSSETWVYERTQALRKHFKLHRDRVIHTNAKHLVRGDFFVDDKVSHVLRWRGSHLDEHAGIPFLWDAYYNRDDPDATGLVRVKSWNELQTAVVSREGNRMRAAQAQILGPSTVQRRLLEGMEASRARLNAQGD